MRRLVLMLSALIVVVAATLVAGRLHFLDIAYERLFGPPDLGPIEFGRLVRRSLPNDALACPPGECGSAEVDVRPQSYPASADDLRRQVRRYFAAQGGVLVESDNEYLHDRFVVRTVWLRFPDTVDVEIFPLDADHATLAVYSRSQLGFWDIGTNLRRVRALLAALGPGVASA